MLDGVKLILRFVRLASCSGDVTIGIIPPPGEGRWQGKSLGGIGRTRFWGTSPFPPPGCIGEVGDKDGVDDVELKDALEFLSEVLPLPEPGRADRSHALCVEPEERPEPLSLESLEKALDSVVTPLITGMLF